MVQISTIHFSELHNYNDGNSIVMIGISPIEETDIPLICSFFEKESGLFSNSKVTEIKQIMGDKPNKNRTDWLIVLDKEDCANPIVRRKFGSFIKWTSDFIDNFKNDYID